MKKPFFLKLLGLFFLLLSCEDDNTIVPKSNQALLTNLIVTISGVDYKATLKGTEGVVALKVDVDIPKNVTIKTVAISEKAKASVNNGESASVSNNAFKLVVTAEDGTKKEYTITLKVSKTSQVTITFNTNGGSVIRHISLKKGQKATQPTNPTKKGETFVGWYKEANFTNLFDFAKETINSNITLYAKYSKVVFVVGFQTNGGSIVTPQIVADNDKAIKPENPTKAGHTFAGWFKEASLTNTFDFTNTAITSVITLYAKWKPLQYTVRFEDSGDSPIASRSIAYGQKVVKPSDPIKTGHFFVNWYKDAQFTTVFDFTTEIIKEATTIYAKYNPFQYTVTFQVNGGSSVDNQVVPYGGKINQNIPTYRGFTFKGWYKDAGFSTPFDYKNDQIKRNTILYAKWEKTIYKIVFNSNGGTAVATQNLELNQKVQLGSAISTRKGYAFKGWFKDMALTQAFNANTDLVTQNGTLYAKWENYVAYNNSGEITGFKNPNLQGSVDIIVPSKINGVTITKIKANAFKGTMANIVSVTIAEGITSIGTSAFELNQNLVTVSIPSSITEIQANAFNFCKSAKITMKATTPPSIGNKAFGVQSTGSSVSNIYVPSATIAAYNSATGNAYNLLIQGIR